METIQDLKNAIYTLADWICRCPQPSLTECNYVRTQWLKDIPRYLIRELAEAEELSITEFPFSPEHLHLFINRYVLTRLFTKWFQSPPLGWDKININDMVLQSVAGNIKAVIVD